MRCVIKNRKGWLRILEAFIAIMLILGVVLVIYTKTVYTPRRAESVYNLQKTIFDEIAVNTDLRTKVLNLDTESIKEFVKDRVPVSFQVEIRICEVDEICNPPEYHENVYASERVISSTLEIYQPKKLKIFMWQE